MSRKAPAENCIEIIAPLLEELNHQGMPPCQLIGGIGSAALKDPRTEILPKTKEVIAPPDLWVPSRREEDNTLRDLDLLVLSTEATDIRKINGLATSIIGNALDVSVFGLQKVSKLEKRSRQFILSTAVGFVSDRYIYDLGQAPRDGVDGHKALFPFAAPITESSLEPWELHIGGNVAHVPHPAVVPLYYAGRSISGLRHRDVEKVNKIATNVFDKFPEALEWIEEGPGKSQLEFARILHTLSTSAWSEEPLILGGKLRIDPLPLGKLASHDYFLLKDRPEKTQQRALNAARAKSRTIKFGEQFDPLVAIWRKYFERYADVFTHNQ
ncbi:hypothetical protein A3F37_02760 [Candidatus Saccharibacteria bacterium RIFCSPHIGHO2_12_FULL_41_12]|nr:MAG: hypothetical protein A3F37_02760 [Candidatus Saccharibacteria bacterium RIFCSPHIGHO2_12_FULL_41_12]